MKTTLLTTTIFLMSFTGFSQVSPLTNSTGNASAITTEKKSIVKYHSFDAVLADRTVICNWSTEQEINHNYFELESSYDGINFKTAAIIFGGEVNSSTLKNYKYKDKNAGSKMNDFIYYRLKQVDNEGFMEYSKKIKVALAEGIVNDLGIVPNPFAGSFNYSFQSPENGYVITRIISLGGRKVFTNHTAVKKGNNTLDLNDLGGLTKGMYIIEVTMNGNVIGRQKINKG